MTYSLVTQKGFCRHANWRPLVLCETSFEFRSTDDCILKCTSHEPCIGFIVHFPGGPIRCHLIPSEKDCPKGFYLTGESLAKTTDELVESANPGHMCYSKNSGMALNIDLHDIDLIGQHKNNTYLRSFFIFSNQYFRKA